MVLMRIGLYIAASLPTSVLACTTFAAGRKATKDGSVIVSHSDDGDVLADGRLMYVPASEHPEGSRRSVYYVEGPYPRKVVWAGDLGDGYEKNEYTDGRGYDTPIGSIPQVAHTFAYHDANYGVINEHNVGIAESTCSAMFYTCAKGDNRHCTPGMTEGVALLSVNTLSQLAMERATTAREAVQLMGDLAYEYGFFGTHDNNGDGEALQVGDANEAWTFHVLADPTGTSAIWAAVRVPDENVTVLANMFNIREVDVTDTANCMASPNVYSIAEERGWWKPGEVLDFTRVYSNGEYGQKYYSGRRMWRGLNMIAPSLNLDPEYSDIRYDRMWPWSTKPDELVEPSHVMRWYRDYLEGTNFDLTKGLVAGYGGTPDRFSKHGFGGFERSIALYRTNLINIVQLRKATPELPRSLAGRVWWAFGPAHYSPFVPLPSGLSRSLKPLSVYNPHKVTKRNLNWAARKTMTVCQVRFDYMHKFVEDWQHEAEALGEKLLESLDAGTSGDLSDVVEAHVEAVAERWDGLPDELLFRFSDNTDILASHPTWRTPGVGADSVIKKFGYPQWWLKGVGIEDFGTPTPPIELQCPPTCPAEEPAEEPAEVATTSLEGTVLSAVPEDSETAGGAWLQTTASYGALGFLAFATGRFSANRRPRVDVLSTHSDAHYGRF